VPATGYRRRSSRANSDAIRAKPLSASLATFPQRRFEQRHGASVTWSPDNPSRPGDRPPVAPDSMPPRGRWRRLDALFSFLAVGLHPSAPSLRAKSVCPPTPNSHA